MEIQEFVRESLCQIIEGVHSANKSKSGIGGAVFVTGGGKVPSNAIVTGTVGKVAFLVEFDIAVSVTDKAEASGKAGISVVHVFSAGGGKSTGTEKTSDTRIKFSVPITYEAKEPNT